MRDLMGQHVQVEEVVVERGIRGRRPRVGRWTLCVERALFWLRFLVHAVEPAHVLQKHEQFCAQFHVM